MFSVLALALAATAPAFALPGQVTAESPHFDLETLYDQGKFTEGKAATEAAIAANPKDPTLYWMMARFMFEIAEQVPKTDTAFDKIAWYQKMVDYTNTGLAVAPNDAHLRFARGIAMGRLGTTRGVLSSLFMAKDIEADWAFAANSGLNYASLGGHEVLPCDAYLTLGIFYRLVPDWWIVQAVAGTRGDLQKSVDWNTKADQCAQNRTQTVKELGVSQICFGQRNKDDAMVQAGLANLARAAALPIIEPTDKIDYKDAQKLIADPSLACEYSRDGQQDLDESKLKK